MQQPICQLLHLILSLLVGGAATQCMDSNQKVSAQLTSSDILHTWQPGGSQCSWWESRQSETNRFPAAVRSGPRWLVMQLRRPLMLEAVSVRGWDGRWHAASRAGSPMSVFGASSLPLELQLEDPCNASWENFNRTDRWIALMSLKKVDQEILRKQAHKPSVSFMLLRNSSGDLQWSALNFTGWHSCLQLLESNSLICTSLHKMKYFAGGEKICFSVLDCSLETRQSALNSVNCSIKSRNGKVVDVKSHSADAKNCRVDFDFTSSLEHQGALLTCYQGSQPAVPLERILLLRIPPQTSVLSLPPVWVSNHQASVGFTTTESSPEPRHLCWIAHNQWNSQWPGPQMLNASSIQRKVVWDSNSRPFFSVKSTFNFTVHDWMQSHFIICKETFGTVVVVSPVVKQHNISAVSKPCVTRLDFERDRIWREGEVRSVSVRSSSCSHWPVTHSCWLLDATEGTLKSLIKTSNTSFISEFWLQASRWMGRRPWLLRCRVNQSGFEYPDVEVSKEELPAVFYKAKLRILSPVIDSTGLSVRVVSTDARPNVTGMSCTAERNDNSGVKRMKQKSLQLWQFTINQLPKLHQLATNFTVRISCSGRQMFNGTDVYSVKTSESFNVAEIIKSTNKLDRSSANASSNRYANIFFGVVAVSMALLSLLFAAFYISRNSATVNLIMESCYAGTQISEGGESSTWELENFDAEVLTQERSCRTQMSKTTPKTSTKHHYQFVKVLTVDLLPKPDKNSNDSDLCSDTDTDEMYTEPSGHYELDGCTFVRYHDCRKRKKATT